MAQPRLVRQPTAEDQAAMMADTEYMSTPLSILVVGASGDLAKKKTYPSLFALYKLGFIPTHATICGYARSDKTDEAFRDHLRPWLLKHGDEDQVTSFLTMCIYRHGPYTSEEALTAVTTELVERESQVDGDANRLFYFAIPPSQFVNVATPLRAVACDNPGWTRVVVEKPFGRDLDSSNELANALSALFDEDQIYRIDHYLGKEMVQNLLAMRFGNTFFEPLWNRNYVQCVIVSFKENIGTGGRGGYFDSYGIIRDVMQNHLLQVLSLVAMEPPVRVAGGNSANFVRDEKVKVLRCIQPLSLEDVVLGQYTGSGSEPGYLEDPTVPEGSLAPTYAAARFYIHNPRWEGVPFIIKCGKALNERKAEVRIQFKDPPSAAMFPTQNLTRNELVIRLQPSEAVYMKTNVKAPGLKTRVETSELDLTYSHRYPCEAIPDAYTRLILDTLRGKQATFVRTDELEAAWRIFTPLLHQIDEENIAPIPYEFGTRGPAEADELLASAGYVYDSTYQWRAEQGLAI